VLATALATLTAVLGYTVGHYADSPSPDDPDSSTPTNASLSAADSPPSPPPVLTLRAVLSSPLPSATDFEDSPVGTVRTSAAQLLAPPSGSPLPSPSTPSNDTNDIARLSPAGQSVIACRKVADSAIQTLCDGSALTPYGQVTFSGATLERQALADPPSADFTLSLTGGTAALASVQGTLAITTRSPTEQDWVFRFTALTSSSTKAER
jgi:hypothetical protein